jgi:hypothetical protein
MSVHRLLSRRDALRAAGAAAALPALSAASQISNTERNTIMSSYQELFEASQKEKKGLTLFVGGQQVVGVVVRVVGSEAVEMTSRTYSRMVVRIDRIDAAALS